MPPKLPFKMRWRLLDALELARHHRQLLLSGHRHDRDGQIGLSELEELDKPEHGHLLDYYREFVKQPPEQLSGIRSTVFNYLQPYTAPDIAEVFCPADPTFDIKEFDLGRLMTIKIPQKYQIEKKYVSLLLKVLFYLHALRRYDLPAEERDQKNLIVLVLDEAQETVLVSEDGISDYNVVDKIRGARATTINSTQSPTSYIPPMGNREKADVFLLNLGNKIYFTAADKQASEMIADSIGKHTIKKRTYGRSLAKATRVGRNRTNTGLSRTSSAPCPSIPPSSSIASGPISGSSFGHRLSPSPNGIKLTALKTFSLLTSSRPRTEPEAGRRGGEAAFGGFLVDAGHLFADLAQRADHLVERNDAADSAQRHGGGAKGVEGIEAVAHHAGGLDVTADRIADQAECILERGCGRLHDLLRRSAVELAESRRRHRAGAADFRWASSGMQPEQPGHDRLIGSMPLPGRVKGTVQADPGGLRRSAKSSRAAQPIRHAPAVWELDGPTMEGPMISKTERLMEILRKASDPGLRR